MYDLLTVRVVRKGEDGLFDSRSSLCESLCFPCSK